MKLISQYLTDHQIKLFEKITKETGIKRAELIRRAIDEFLKNK